MGQTHENDKNTQKFITFIKSNEFEKSFRNIVVGGQYFIFASQNTVLPLYHVIIWVHGIPPIWYPSGTISKWISIDSKLTAE